jgi:hypothetical protein
MSEQPPTTVAPLHGERHAVPWPTPPIPGTSTISFWGKGDAVTEPFTLPGDASIRIALETGPMELRVLRPDGSAGATVAPIPNAGMALAAIPEGGIYTLEVKTAGAWGITVVFMTAREV